MKKVAIVSCLVLPEPDVDEQLTLQAVREQGMSAELVAWDDHSADWSQFDAAVLRSPWNYPEHPEQFKQFVQRVSSATKLINDAETVLANLHKGYLIKLEKLGIPIVPTQLVSQITDLEGAMNLGWEKVVIKPAVGAGSMGTQSFDDLGSAEAKTHLRELLLEGDALIQPFMESVNNGGERSLIWIDGEFTHKIVKSPRFIGQDESVSAAVEISENEIELGLKIMTTVKAELLYARVDLMLDNGGQLALSELELIEPSLFFMQHPPAAQAFASGLRRMLG